MALTDFPRIVIDPAVCGGRPIIAGTRMRVVDILKMLASGGSVSEIVEDFPYLSEEDVSAALAYGAAVIDQPGRLSRQAEIRSLRGKLEWWGDLNAMSNE
jgi:uncharacterized protein (DUF433 family)